MVTQMRLPKISNNSSFIKLISKIYVDINRPELLSYLVGSPLFVLVGTGICTDSKLFKKVRIKTDESLEKNGTFVSHFPQARNTYVNGMKKKNSKRQWEKNKVSHLSSLTFTAVVITDTRIV